MRPKLIFSNYKFRCPAKRAGPPLESKWKCEKIAPIRAFVRMKREKEGYDISERADNYLNNPETRASAKDLVGIWIGFDSDQLTFTRLDLRLDSTGFCARVSPADTILHAQSVHVYRVTKW